MQINENLGLRPAIANVDGLIKRLKGKKSKKSRSILSDLRELEVFLKCKQARAEGRYLYEDEKGRLVELRS